MNVIKNWEATMSISLIKENVATRTAHTKIYIDYFGSYAG
jgi:hypothetical protein